MLSGFVVTITILCRAGAGGVLYDLHVTTRRTLCVNCAHLRTSRGEYDEHTVTNTTRRSHQQTHRLTFLLPLSVGFDLLGLTGL